MAMKEPGAMDAAAKAAGAKDAEARLSRREMLGGVGSAAALLAAGKADPDRIASLWRAEWTRRLPPHRGRSSLLAETVRLIAEHLTAFREPRHVDGWALRRALHARLSRLFRPATLDPAEAFIFLALSALDFERLRGEILRRVAFPRLPLAP